MSRCSTPHCATASRPPASLTLQLKSLRLHAFSFRTCTLTVWKSVLHASPKGKRSGSGPSSNGRNTAAVSNAWRFSDSSTAGNLQTGSASAAEKFSTCSRRDPKLTAAYSSARSRNSTSPTSAAKSNRLGKWDLPSTSISKTGPTA